MSTTDTADKQYLKGGEFLVKESTPAETFVPEELTDEQRAMREMASQFVTENVLPAIDRIEKQDFELTVKLMNKAGELGLLAAALPEEYGGLSVDFNAETAITEELGKAQSFGVTIAAHTGIGTLPVLYFGTEAQKKQYLPKLATGEWKAAYALTEPGSGSDAMAAKTQAVPTDDGKHYLLNGQKMWITNSGFADVFTVFAQVNEKDFTGFIVDAKSPGISLGTEEHKMGIKGSSTRQVFFENVKVPVENVLGEIGKGHRIAFNVLNIGRYKLCVMVLGGAKAVSTVSVQYANERKQFQKPIASFGAIQHKLAEQAIRIYAIESATYRTSGLISSMIQNLVAKGTDPVAAKLQAAEEYSIECAMLKVLGSEMLDYVVDEGVQIHGGMGYSEEMLVCRAYRDSRINRIFEGTNEINRLLTVDMLMKKAMKGSLNLMGPAMAVQKELMSIPDMGNDDNQPLSAAFRAVKQAKKAVLMVAGAAVQKLMQKLESEQELLMHIADMLMEVYTCESLLLRVAKADIADGQHDLHHAMLKVYFSNAMERIHHHGKEAISGFAEGDELRMMMMGLKRFTKYEQVNNKELRRTIAQKLIAENRYCF
jgi:hypothetical protein